MLDSLEALRDFIARGWIGTPGTTLRREDEKKARELVGLVRETAFLLAQPRSRNGAIVDAASGKGYIGLAIAARTGRRVSFFERDPVRTAATLRAADALGIDRALVDARTTDVGAREAWPEAPALVVSLHACGDATDRVIAESVAARARAILVAPCCVAGDLPAAKRALARAEAAGLDRHAEVRRRLIEGFVLGERILTLEAAGYQVEVVPFASPSVTPYNVAIRGTVAPAPERMRGASEALRDLSS